MTPALQASTPIVLLRANREVLQSESQKWMDALGFLGHEIKFYEKMLRIKNCISNNSILQRNMKNVLGNKLVPQLEDLEKDLMIYRKKLGEWAENGNGSLNWNYEEEHRRLNNRVEKLKLDMQLFKESAFEFIADMYLEKETINFI